jgi:peptidoglycan hydrolase-like protein with peptidoglycan-binding domain
MSAVKNIKKNFFKSSIAIIIIALIQIPTTTSVSATLHPLSSVPVLNSFPSAPVTLYLDFLGDPADHNTPAYDIDNDPTTFSDQELANINEIWQRVSEKFSPFNINVTTVAPASIVPAVTLKQLIGGSGGWYGAATGATNRGAFFDPSTSYVFSQNLGSTLAIGETAAHEAGHGFGLQHHGVFNSSGVLTSQYSHGDAYSAPIMGTSYYSIRGLWSNASTTNYTELQDDIGILSGNINNFGYRPQDHGQSSSTAETLTGPTINATGIIASTTDTDYFKFTSTGGTATFTLTGAPYSQMLRGRLELRNSTDAVIATAADPTVLNPSLSATLSPGTYYIVAESYGAYGDIGQYTLSGLINTSGHTVTASASAGGTISPTGTLSVADASSQAFTITPNAHHTISALNIDGASVATTSSYTFSNIATNHTIAATFALDNQSITLTNANQTFGIATVTPSQLSYLYGDTVSISAVPNVGYAFTGWTGSVTSALNPLSVTLDANKTIAANFIVNNAPNVSAGTDQTITLPSTVTLTGTTTDDGSPLGLLSVQWTKVSGPGTVTFNNIVSTSTTATFSAAGSYVLKLTADDSATTTSSSITVTVNSVPAPAPVPVVSSGGGGGGGTSFVQPIITQSTIATTTTTTIIPNGATIITVPSYQNNIQHLNSISKKLIVGSNNNDVITLQKILTDLGYFHGSITGYLGKASSAALKKFQKDYSLAPTGTVNSATRISLNKIIVTINNHIAAPEILPTVQHVHNTQLLTKSLYLNDSGREVTTLQQFLFDRGYLSVKPNGNYGYQTSNAVKKFQKKYGIQQSGNVGLKTRNKINALLAL